MISKGQTETNRYRFLARNGGFVWVVTQATVVFDKQKPQSVVCVNYVIRWVHPTFLFPGRIKFSCQTLSLYKNELTASLFVLISQLLYETKHVREASFVIQKGKSSQEPNGVKSIFLPLLWTIFQDEESFKTFQPTLFLAKELIDCLVTKDFYQEKKETSLLIRALISIIQCSTRVVS